MEHPKPSSDCSICCDTFTKAKRAPVTCLKCGFRCCRACLEKYILNHESLTQIQCMMPDCDCVWDRAFLAQHLTQVCMRKKYPHHRGNLLLQHEISRMPETMPFVERFKKADKLEEKRRAMAEEVAELRNRQRALNLQIYHMGREVHRLKYNQDQTPEKAREFIRQCPGDGCRGFLSNHWRCRLCELHVCSKCHAIKGHVPKGIKPTAAFADHQCNENDLKTVAMLRKDTKPCPTCGVPINKISGCDQMWCTQCKVAFSWRTGRRINGVIHNPHFYQWQREGGGGGGGGGGVPRAMGDIRCGGLPHYSRLRLLIRRPAGMLKWVASYKVPEGEAQPKDQGEARRRDIHTWGRELTDLHRALIHFNRVELRRHQVHGDNDENLHLRIDYLLGKKSAESMKQQLITHDKKKVRQNDIYHIMQLMDNVAMERFIALCAEFTFENAKLCFNECNRVRNYCNNELKKISAIDGLMVPIIQETFYTHTAKFTKKNVGW